MGCCGDREKGPTKESQKWQFITLADFKSTSAWNTPAYVWLWLLFISTIVVYAVDTFTAINLLIFNKWSSQVKPAISFDISKWIFAGCILFSWVLWAFEWIRAIRVIQGGGVAASYMDPLAVSLQSMRSQGWRRFLVFAELTKSKKGMDLVAFFTYFAFKGAIRIIAAEGPRQVINILTLIAVVKADFVDSTDRQYSGISLFWFNLQKMWNANHLEAVIIFSMMYSLLIWAFSVICLASAGTLYIVFLWHYIPQQDGGLSKYCRRKIDKRLEKIVESKVKAAIEEEERRRKKAEEKDWKAAQKAEKKGKPFEGAPGVKAGISRQPTLPQLDGMDRKEDELDGHSLRRTDTGGSTSTLPPYASRPSTRNENRPPVPMYNGERPPPLRSATNGSQWTASSYESDAPLLSNAAGVGESLPSRPPTAFRQDSNPYGRPMQRQMTASTQDSNQYGRPPQRQMTGQTQRPYSPAPGRPGPEGPRSFSPMLKTDFSQGAGVAPPTRSDSPYTRNESPYRGPGTPIDRNAMPSRTGTVNTYERPYQQQVSRQPTHTSSNSSSSFSRPLPQRGASQSSNRPYTPASETASPDSYEMKTNPYTSKASTVDTPSTYVAFNPNRIASPAPRPTAPMRSNTGETQDYFSHRGLATHTPNRSLTAPPTQDNRATIGYSDLVDDYSTTPDSHEATLHQPGYSQRF